jgi:hypothetical protein
MSRVRFANALGGRTAFSANHGKRILKIVFLWVKPMHARLLCNLTLLISMIGAAAIQSANAQSITVYDFVGIDKNLLDGNEFSAYQKISIPTMGSGYVNRGTCSKLKFTAYITPTGSWEKHTFTAKLKKDGADVQTAEKELGPFFISKTLFVDFSEENFRPGTWSIEWHWLTQAATTGAESIKLAAPALVTFSQTMDPWSWIGSAELKQVFCDRGSGSATSTAYVNELCEYRTQPPTAFIFNNSYYRTASITSSTCPFGAPAESNLCHAATAPRSLFIWGNNFYFEPLGSSFSLFSWFTGFCEPSILAVPASAGQYSVTRVWGRGCRVNLPPYWWQSPVIVGAPWDNRRKNVYLTQRKTGSCAEGSFDGANCFIASPPAGTSALAAGGKWYWTPRYCD